MPTLPHSPTPAATAPPMRGFAIAGSVVVLGLLAAMFGSTEPAVRPKEKQAQGVPRIDGVQPVQVARIKPAVLPDLLAPKLALDTPQTSEITPPDPKELSLTERLDDFFLNNVALHRLPLGQAMAMLKQMLVTADKQKTLAIHKLIVSIPTAALGRLVTLHSTSISYLEAVQTLAAMAGCDVELGEHRITLKVQPGSWPQVAEKRSMMDMMTFKGSDFVKTDTSDQIAEVKEVARRLGLKFDDDNTARLTTSEWETLQRAMAYRDRLARSMIPPYAVYLLPEGYLSPIFQVTPQQVVQLMLTLNQQGFPAYADVPYALLDPTIAQQIVIIMRAGDRVVISQHTTIPVAKQPEYEEYAQSPQPSASSEAATYNDHAAYMGITRIGEGEESRLVQTEAASSVTAAAMTRAVVLTQGFGRGTMLQPPQSPAEPTTSVPANPATAPAAP